MQNLQLDRPLVCFDLETTGLDVQKDRIVQISLIRVEPSGERRVFTSLVNPQRPIPPEASAIHGIRDEHVRSEPSFSQLREEVEEILEGADLAGFNMVRFDLPLLEAEIQREGGRFSAMDTGISTTRTPSRSARMTNSEANRSLSTTQRVAVRVSASRRNALRPWVSVPRKPSRIRSNPLMVRVAMRRTTGRLSAAPAMALEPTTSSASPVRSSSSARAWKSASHRSISSHITKRPRASSIPRRSAAP